LILVIVFKKELSFWALAKNLCYTAGSFTASGGSGWHFVSLIRN